LVGKRGGIRRVTCHRGTKRKQKSDLPILSELDHSLVAVGHLVHVVAIGDEYAPAEEVGRVSGSLLKMPRGLPEPDGRNAVFPKASNSLQSYEIGERVPPFISRPGPVARTTDGFTMPRRSQ
jgi:hypothetical protein